jgi:uncharacterized repeat protein (TIGR03803 family)
MSEQRMKSLRLPLLIVVVVLLQTVLMMGLASAQTFTTLYAFTGMDDGEHPVDYGHMVMDAKGNVYGTTTSTFGQQQGDGTVFRVTPTGQEKVIHRFTGKDGKDPVPALIHDNAGNLYGTTWAGGAYGWGAVFKLTMGTTGWTETIMYSFQNAGDGFSPQGLAVDSHGNIYGVAQGGRYGKYHTGHGTVFRIDTSGNFTVLYSFKGGADGIAPLGVVVDPAGNVYGTTMEGGDLNCNVPIGFTGCGLVFRISPTGQETVLHSFTGNGDGDYLVGSSGLILDVKGRALYGATYFGGESCALDTYGCGVIFKLDATGETVVYSFTGEIDGGAANAIVRDAAGNFFGSTGSGGDLACNPPYGCGELFKLDTSGNFTLLYAFEEPDLQPNGLVLDPADNLYGISQIGGNNYGTVFELTNAKNAE